MRRLRRALRRLLRGIPLPVLTNTLMDFIKESTGGEFSNWGDIFSNLGDLEGLTEQFQNGGLEGLPIE